MRIKNNDSICRSEVQPCPSCGRGYEKDEFVGVVVERVDYPHALFLFRLAVKVAHIGPVPYSARRGGRPKR